MAELILYARSTSSGSWSWPFWAPLALLGFPPWMILTQQAISLIYQFWIHTERVKKLPAPLEYVLNTPSHHRVHHGSNEVYLDRNYGGILIVALARDVRHAKGWRGGGTRG